MNPSHIMNELTEPTTGGQSPKRVPLLVWVGLLLFVNGGMNFAVTEAQVRAIVTDEIEHKLERIEEQNQTLETELIELRKALKQ